MTVNKCSHHIRGCQSYRERKPVMEIIANESENGLDSTKAECSPTISQVCTGYLGEYTGIFLHVKLQIEQLPFKNLESIETIKKLKQVNTYNIRNQKDTMACLESGEC